MLTATERLRRDALTIWQAGVEAVTPQRLFGDKVQVVGTRLCVEGVELELGSARRLIIVGAGKASAAMAVALQQTVLARLPGSLQGLPVEGWINAPAGAICERERQALEPIHVHPARPAGSNLPTQAAVAGTHRILQLVQSADQRDVVICLLSGGGSALLVAPRAGVTLEDKQAIASEIAAAGGNIEQLTTVRRAVSQGKGGGLARACRARHMLTLVLSDVLGDPLETIASGPTWLAAEASVQQAWQTLQQLDLLQSASLAGVVRWLENQLQAQGDATGQASAAGDRRACHVEHVILGNNADAIDAAGVKAVELGYRYVMQGARRVEGDVQQVALTAVAAIEQLIGQSNIDCWICGGEPTVTLPAGGGGRGGRNQQLALAVLRGLQRQGWPATAAACRQVLFLSGGTDGEDGPTDAAGAWFDAASSQRAALLGLQPEDYLARADAYHFFEQAGGLLITGPTGTNVCDLRIALAERPASDIPT